MDIQRTVLWVVFSMSLLFLWDHWMRDHGHTSLFFPTVSQPAKPAAHDGNGRAPDQSPNIDAASANTAAANANAATPATVPGTPAAKALKGETITITTDLYKADFDTVGGVLKRLELLKQKEDIEHCEYSLFLCFDAYAELFGIKKNTDHPKNVVLFDVNSEEGRIYLARTGLIGGATDAPFPNHHSIFVAKPGPRSLDGSNTVSLVLESEQNGVKLTKTFTFKRGSYVIDVKHEVTNIGHAPVTPSLYLQLLHDGSKPVSNNRFRSTYTGPTVYTNEAHFQKLDFKKIAEHKDEHVSQTDNGWIALVQHFFVSAFIPQDHAKRRIVTEEVAPNEYAISTILPLGTLAPGASTTMDARLYSGPQQTTLLEKVAPGLELVKDYGWLTIIAKPLFWVMAQLHNLLGNWGWTIIVFTIAIKLAFFPLSAAGYRSMAKMKVVTPKMTAIRERYKSDPQKMNQAMMELYKTEKINPLGGCLPILIQMPVFIALYWVLQASVEIRYAPWIGWIHDLAAPDPLYILPVVYAVSMFITTKLNPAPADPMQAKMMLFMPLVFSVMFFFFPSGLVLYWVVNNVLSIGQQWVITKKMGVPRRT